VNLKPHLQTTLRTLLEANASQREIERGTGIDRKTIRAYSRRFAEEAAANSPGGHRPGRSNSPTPATDCGRGDDVELRAAPGVHRGAVAAAPQRHGDLACSAAWTRSGTTATRLC